MSAQNYYNQMAPFWDFVADLEERGRSHPWFGGRGGARGGARRAANRGEAAENNTERPNPWTENAGFGFPFGEMPHRHRHGHGPGRWGGRRQQRREAADEPEETGVLTPDTEKEAEIENEKAPVEEVLFDAEKVAPTNEGRRGPGFRRGGRGGRGTGMGRGRGAGPRARALNNEEPNVAIQVENEKSGVDEPARRGPGARRGGPGPRGAGRGGAGRGMGHGMGRGGRFAARAALNHPEMFAGPWGPAFAPWHPAFGLFGPAAFGPHGPGFGPRGGRLGPRRGGPGAALGRRCGAGPARARNAQADAPNAEVENGPPRGPGARRGGPGGRGGRGMGAGRGRGPAAVARGLSEESTPAAQPAAGRPRAGPAGRRLNQGPNAVRGQGPNKGRGKFRPDIDLFDHPEAFVIHASLPGAKKDEIEVNWDSEKSRLSITGHINRTTDEELLKSMEKSERKVGDFQRRVRLASPANPHPPVDVEGITATMEDGVLRIEVPKLDSGYVEVKKVNIN